MWIFQLSRAEEVLYAHMFFKIYPSFPKKEIVIDNFVASHMVRFYGSATTRGTGLL
ncbi:hypothetical protein SAMN04488116_0348 [Flagellimonas flava]|uniref:Uncharacterized protein n=1 Tax=Flagellimonas flava TaxID=570519 RepID=A0A1M5I0F0_9FLAO|nr:hypothetical protein SAMN04488116_0348 [Allomuricauda flava]